MTQQITDAERALSEQIDELREGIKRHEEMAGMASAEIAVLTDALAEQRLQYVALFGQLESTTAELARLREEIQTAYGYLWCVNNEPGTPIALYPPEKAAYEARKVLRDLLTVAQRGQGINSVLPIVRAQQ